MINTACNHDAVALADFIQYHDAIQAQKPYDPVADKDAIRDISAIAAGISVAQAAKSSSIHPRECQMTRSNNAVHEAAHVVIDTVYKRWVTSIFIPTLGSDGKVMRANLHEHEGQGTASSY